MKKFNVQYQRTRGSTVAFQGRRQVYGRVDEVSGCLICSYF